MSLLRLGFVIVIFLHFLDQTLQRTLILLFRLEPLLKGRTIATMIFVGILLFNCSRFLTLLSDFVSEPFFELLLKKDSFSYTRTVRLLMTSVCGLF